VWDRLTHWLETRRVHVLHRLRPCQAGAPVFLLLHVAGDKWTRAIAPNATLQHFGGDLHASLHDVHRRVAISASLQALPCVALLQV
jgi:hypothetical protein